MALKLIDLVCWEWREFCEHSINKVVCTYSAVVNIACFSTFIKLFLDSAQDT